MSADDRDPERNYAKEARDIIAEQGLYRVPERAHLLALDSQLQTMNQNVILLGELLLAILLDRGEPALQIPKALLNDVKKSNTMPLIHRQPDGSIVVKVIPLAPGINAKANAKHNGHGRVM